MMSVTLLFWIPPREFIKLISFNDFAAYLKENKLLKNIFDTFFGTGDLWGVSRGHWNSTRAAFCILDKLLSGLYP